MICNKRIMWQEKESNSGEVPFGMHEHLIGQREIKKTMCLSRGRKFCFFKGHSYDLSLLSSIYGNSISRFYC